MDIALHGRVVRQEGEVAGSVFPQSGTRLMTASARVIFSTPPLLFPVQDPTYGMVPDMCRMDFSSPVTAIWK